MVDVISRFRTTKNFLFSHKSIPAVLYFFLLTSVLNWPMFFGKSSNVVQGFSKQVFPWRLVPGNSALPLPPRDAAATSFPHSVSYHEAFSSGKFPMWDWHSFIGGYDMASDGVSGIFYPLRLVLWFFFEPALAHDIFVFSHYFLGGFTMYLLIRQLKLPFVSGLVGGTIWMFCAFNVVWIQAEMVGPIIFVLPLVFLTISRCLEKRTLERIACAGISIVIAFTAGNLVMFLIIAWLGGLYAIGVIAWGMLKSTTRKDALHQMVTMAWVGVTSAAMTAFYLIPTMYSLLNLDRKTTSLRGTVMPEYNQDTVRHYLWNDPLPIADYTDIFALNWVGRIALILAVIGLTVRTKARWLGIGLAVTFTVLPVTKYVLALLWFSVPPIQAVAGFGRLFFLASFGFALLAASGTKGILTFSSFVARRCKREHFISHIHIAISCIVLALVLAELFPFAKDATPPWTQRKAENFFPRTPIDTTIEESANPESWPPLLVPIAGKGDPKIQWSGFSYWGSTAHLGKFDSVGGYASTIPSRTSSLVRVLQGTPVEQATLPFSGAFLTNFSAEWTRIDLMERIGATHVYLPPGINLEDSNYEQNLNLSKIYEGEFGEVYKLKGAQRGPRFATEAIYAKTPNAALTSFTSQKFDVTRNVILESKEEARSSSCSDANISNVELSSQRSSNSVNVKVNSPCAGWIVLPTNYSPGWSAKLDNNENIAISRADYAFMAVQVPKGEHTIKFDYRPPGFNLGVAISASTILVFAGLSIYKYRRNRKVQSLVKTSES